MASVILETDLPVGRQGMDKNNLKGLSLDELETFLLPIGFKRYRARQVVHWVYQKGAMSIDEITELSKDDRRRLSETAYISNLRLIREQKSIDGTCKYLFELEDGERIESVLIHDEDRLTLCISTQVGCGFGCRFCLTGKIGLKRNLDTAEIIDQVISVRRMIAPSSRCNRALSYLSARREPSHLTNIVLMGMGEPLTNYDNTLKALKIITAPWGLSISPRRITLSTAGITPKIKNLGESEIKVNLAISLNGTTDEQRSYLMPINKKYSLLSLLKACKEYPLAPRRRITFEYVMLRDINDSIEDAKRLCGLLKGIRCKINLIPFNKFPGAEFEAPDISTIEKFQKILTDAHYTAFIRKSKGADISAACGQLGGGNEYKRN